jgi:hypothetical protein
VTDAEWEDVFARLDALKYAAVDVQDYLLAMFWQETKRFFNDWYVRGGR